VPLSILILTKNEAQDLPGCLASVAFCDDIHVLDSESTDGTGDIAAAAGAHVTVRRFDTYSRQRNAGLALPFKHPWVFVLDADERPTPELAREMQTAVASAPADVDAFRIRRRDFLWGTWLQHAQLTPLYLRLFRVGKVAYTRDINEIAEVSGRIVDLTAPLDHMPFSKGLAHWVSKHNEYSTREAELFLDRSATADASVRAALFAPDLHQRRRAQKAIFYKLPARPLLKWFGMMFVRGAVLDGAAGVTYATLQSFYEYLIEAKRRELERKRSGLPL
jgi:glycosyltransferase involved in cell wall biosynthesis